MRLIYEGVDISGDVDIHRCTHRDVSGGRCDSMDLSLEHLGAWYAWQPARDDAIEIEHEGYSTGKLFLNTILPENGRYRIIATSLPSTAMQRKWQSFQDMRLGDIMRNCAAQSGMDWALYGLDENIRYPYIERKNESCPSFLNRLMQMEGGTLKCVAGRMAGIGIKYAQDLDAGQAIELRAEQDALQYRRREDTKYGGITVLTPYAQASAQDDTAAGRVHITCDLPATNAIQAARWARGMLLANNRQAERLKCCMELNIGMTAMARIDITGGTDADGKWIVDEAEHDFLNEKTTVQLLRCIDTIQ